MLSKFWHRNDLYHCAPACSHHDSCTSTFKCTKPSCLRHKFEQNIHVELNDVHAVSVEEELNDSPLQDLHQACESAHSSVTLTDKEAVSEWSAMNDSLIGLAAEVHNAAPAQLFNAESGVIQAPPPEAQQQQLQCITQVQYAALMASVFLLSPHLSLAHVKPTGYLALGHTPVVVAMIQMQCNG